MIATGLLELLNSTEVRSERSMSDSDIIAVDIVVDITEEYPVEHAEVVSFLFLYYDDFKIVIICPIGVFRGQK